MTKQTTLPQAIARAIKPLGAGLAIMLTSQAPAFNVTSAITGWWEQPNEQNHGLIVSTSQLPDGSQIGVIFWAHYDADGRPTWLLGQGEIDGESINADLYQVSGINFMQPAGTVENPEEQVGEFTLTLNDCASGQVEYSTQLTDVGAGEFEIERLTKLPGLPCSGGITDDIPATATAERFSVELQAASNAAGARGSVEWVLAGGTAELDIEIENVSVGDYRVMIGGIDRGEINAQPDDGDNDADGEIEFYSPQRGFNPLLDFDPRGQAVAIQRDGQTILSATLPAEGSLVGFDYDDAEGERSLRQVMTNSGTFPSGRAVAEWERDDDYVNFEVDVDDIPAGRYSLVVDTIARGVIDVRQDSDGDTDGEIEFYSPARAGYPVLDFDPQGALVEVVDGSTTLFFTDFGTASDNDASDDTGSADDDWTWQGSDRDIRFRLGNQGVYPRAYADVYYSLDEQGLEFEVEIEDVPAGAYTLKVGGIERGTIQATGDGDDDNDSPFDAEGEIEFSENPDDADELLLDFSVRGETIEILEGDTVIFSGTFPNA